MGPLYLLGAQGRCARYQPPDRFGDDAGARCPATERTLAPDPLSALGAGAAGAGGLSPEWSVRADLGCQLQAGAGRVCLLQRSPLLHPPRFLLSQAPLPRTAGSADGQSFPGVRGDWLQLHPLRACAGATPGQTVAAGARYAGAGSLRLSAKRNRTSGGRHQSRDLPERERVAQSRPAQPQGILSAGEQGLPPRSPTGEHPQSVAGGISGRGAYG